MMEEFIFEEIEVRLEINLVDWYLVTRSFTLFIYDFSFFYCKPLVYSVL